MKTSEERFLSECGLGPADDRTKEVAIAVRNTLFSYVDGGKLSEGKQDILPGDRIESDLYLHYLDSLNLVDAILELEGLGIGVTQTDVEEILELNRSDDRITTIIKKIVDSDRRHSPEA